MPAVRLARPFVVDFGLAKGGQATGLSPRLTRSGEALGTPAYMSPEQARGEGTGRSGLSPASDVWALGCVLYECLAGRRAFEGDAPAEVVAAVLTREPPPVRSVAAALPRSVAAVVATCLCKASGDRYPAAAALRDDLARVLAGQSPRTVRRRRTPARLAAALIGAMAIALAMAMGWRGADGPVPPAGNPDDRWVDLAARGWSLRSTEPAEARRCLAAALDAVPDRHAWRVELGLLHWSAGDDDRALAEWARVPADAPEADRVAWLRGLLRFTAALAASRRADVSAARAEWSAAPGRDRAARSLADAALALSSDRHDDARRLVGEPASWDAALLRGFIESSALLRGLRSDGPAGIRAYDRAIEGGIPLAWAFANRGLLHATVGDAGRAEADYEAALRLDPRSTVAWNGRAMLRLAAGDAPAAVEAFDSALRITPDDPDLLTNRGVARRQAGDFNGALQDVEAALDRDPNHVRARFNRGLVVFDLHRYAEAVADFTAVLAAMADYPEAHRYRGLARELGGDRDAAFDDYTAALAREPGDPIARRHRGALRLERGDRFGARDDLQLARQSSPDDPQVAALTAWVLYQCGDWAEAVAGARRTLAMAGAASQADRMQYVIRQCEARLAGAAPR